MEIGFSVAGLVLQLLRSLRDIEATALEREVEVTAEALATSAEVSSHCETFSAATAAT